MYCIQAKEVSRVPLAQSVVVEREFRFRVDPEEWDGSQEAEALHRAAQGLKGPLASEPRVTIQGLVITVTNRSIEGSTAP